MFGKHTNTVLALAAFVSLGVLMPDMSGTTRKLSAEQEAASGRALASRRLAADISKCTDVVEIDLDTFESDADGWSIDKTYDLGGSKILGRFALGEEPSKTYSVGTDSDFVKVEFDFFKLDSWDNDSRNGFDKLFMTINGDETIIYNAGDSGTRSEETAAGVKWEASTVDAPSQLGGSTRYQDQLVKVLAYVPASLYTSGMLELKLRVDVNQGHTDESAGFDNFKLSAMKGCDDTVVPVPLNPTTCSSETPKAKDDFNTGDGGYVNGTTFQLNNGEQLLGQFGVGRTGASKTYKVDTDSDFVKVEFDFYEMDSWDNSTKYGFDTLVITINDEKVSAGVFHGASKDDGTRGGKTLNGIEWSTTSTPPEQLGIGPWMDQKHLFVAYVPAALYPDGTITLGFTANVNQGMSDESAGFDNVVLTALNDCTSGGGVNGDPLIMGLAGQLFKFDGRSGAWYSAVSSKSFQWNMKIHEYDECPADANKFVSGVGFTLFKKTKAGHREPAHKIVVNVVNEFGVQTGCGTEATNCLGNGSLELIIDDKKFLYPGDYQLQDGTGRVIAFNTFYECSRKWYDFDVTPVSDETSSLRANRRELMKFPGVFDVVKGLKNNVVDRDVCDEWLAERKEHNDLFSQAGEWSTIIVKTDDISFHVEYKQEHNRCDAHTVDVWIAGVSPDLYDEDWEGVIGETKDPANHGDEKVERVEFLKFPDDESYEVVSPFSAKCAGCYEN